MKNIFKIIILIAVAIFSNSYALSVGRKSMKIYEGVYLGFSPTDESAVGVGEM